MIVGLTGGIGTGKTAACGIFKHLGVPVISADEIAHHIVDTDKSVFQAIVQKFGRDFLNAQNKIDRHKLREQIFSIAEDKIWLEKLLHPIIATTIKQQAKAITYPYCIVEIPLLFEANMQDIVDRILTMDCPAELQLKRALQRGVHTEAEIKAFIATQITRDRRLAMTNDIIENTGDMPALIKRIEQLHQLYLSLAT